MELLLRDIEIALDTKLYCVALQSTLTLPDICAALISPNGKSSGEKYINWYDTYAKEPGRNALSGSDCYYFRCSYIHQGSSVNPRGSYSRVLFIPPHPNQRLFGHNNVINGCLQIDICVFCENMIGSVRKWMHQVENSPIYIANKNKLLRLYPNGLAPYIVGCPVIT